MGTTGFLMDGRLLAKLNRLFASMVTIQSGGETQDEIGGVVVGWSDVTAPTDLRNLKCYVAAGRADEHQGADLTAVVGEKFIEIAGYYPTIVAKMRAFVSPFAYDILEVAHDSQQKTTRLRVQLVTT